MNDEPYVTISLDKSGRVLRVRQGGRDILPEKSEPGPTRVGQDIGGRVVASVILHELLVHRRRPKPDDPPPADDPPRPPSDPPEGTDPCCYRDPMTGQRFCWC
jgi:hypothetical protein